MKSVQTYSIVKNEKLVKDVFKMVLKGDTTWIEKPGQFVNVSVENAYLKRPISVSDWSDEELTLIYKVVGEGTKWMSEQSCLKEIEVLVGLGNGFTVNTHRESLVIGGGVGIPPLYRLCKELIQKGSNVHVLLGFNTKDECFYADEFGRLGAHVTVCTVDGSVGTKGFVTAAMTEPLKNVPYYTCGPLPMLESIFNASHTSGQLSFEERMGCGFGACMGCSCKTLTGYKRICVEGPVMMSEEILWKKD